MVYTRRHPSGHRATSAPREPSSVSKLEAPCEGHDVVRVDLIPNRPQPLQILPIQRLNRCSNQRVIPIQRGIGYVLPFVDGRSLNCVRALPQGGGDLGVIRRRGPCEVDVRWEERARAVGRVGGEDAGVIK